MPHFKLVLLFNGHVNGNGSKSLFGHIGDAERRWASSGLLFHECFVKEFLVSYRKAVECCWTGDEKRMTQNY